ncbi:NUDIX domain-containing protein [archaeon]|jgi:8-oxo-dGTP pyrophosphatase MutT (NUDIX family)|nr:NUDIX domain-containing protein [archaeon]MBT6697847.1 NUDIX domain-containing protein [archaeon]
MNKYRHGLAVDIALLKEDKVFLIRRKGSDFADGEYRTPGGKIDPGEDALMAAVREAKEEIGVNILPEKMSPEIKNALLKGLKGENFSSFGFDLKKSEEK